MTQDNRLTNFMNALIYTNEYPPYNYGGAGVHVEYLTRELSKLSDVDVDVRAFGDQDAPKYPLKVQGYPVDTDAFGAPKSLHSIFGSSQRAISYNADGNEADIVHCHTWYTHLAGIMTKLNYGIPPRHHRPLARTAPPLEARATRRRLRFQLLGRKDCTGNGGCRHRSL